MIEGRLARLRAVEPDDAERAYRWINDREVTRNLMARYPFSLQWEKEWVEGAAKRTGYDDLALAIETLDGVHIGQCGLHKGRPEDRHAELGIMIGDKDYWNRGFGTDAMLTLVRFAFEQMNLNKVALGVMEFNERAQAVYRKVGFVEEGRAREDYYQDGRYWDIVRMSVLRREFDALHGLSDAAIAADGATP
jgi:RimJ/RimL family protein N-acetyltransferase